MEKNLSKKRKRKIKSFYRHCDIFEKCFISGTLHEDIIQSYKRATYSTFVFFMYGYATNCNILAMP